MNSMISKNTESKTHIPRGRKILFSLVMLGLVLAICEVILEIGMRQFHLFPPSVYVRSKVPGLLCEGRKNFTYHMGGHTMHMNAQGFRGPDFSKKKAAGRPRVAVLGDSMTHAVMLPYEDTYPVRMEKLLQKSMKPGAPEFLNFALGGYNTTQEWLTYQYKIKEYQPDMLVVQFLLNDVQWAYPLTRNPSRIMLFREFLGNHSRTYLMFKHFKNLLIKQEATSFKNLENLDPAKHPVSPGFMAPYYEPGSRLFRDWEQNISKFGDLNARGTPVLFAIFPWTVWQGMNSGTPYPYFKYHEQVIAVLEKNNLPYIEVTNELLEHGNLHDFWVRPDDFHLNAKAHSIIARTLAPRVQQMLSHNKSATENIYQLRLNGYGMK